MQRATVLLPQIITSLNYTYIYFFVSTAVDAQYENHPLPNDDQSGSSQHKVPKKAEYVNFPPPARHQGNQDYENPEVMGRPYGDVDKMANGYVNTREVNNLYAAVITEDICTAPNTYDQIRPVSMLQY